MALNSYKKLDGKPNFHVMHSKKIPSEPHVKCSPKGISMSLNFQIDLRNLLFFIFSCRDIQRFQQLQPLLQPEE
jgi:hypothetical protein